MHVEKSIYIQYSELGFEPTTYWSRVHSITTRPGLRPSGPCNISSSSSLLEIQNQLNIQILTNDVVRRSTERKKIILFVQKIVAQKYFVKHFCKIFFSKNFFLPRLENKIFWIEYFSLAPSVVWSLLKISGFLFQG